MRGTVRPVDAGQPWLVARHIGGELTVLRVDGWRAGDPRQPAGQRAAPHAGRRAPRRSTPAQRSLYTGLVIGDDREQPADLADVFRGAGLTHLLAVSGQNVAFVLALAGPLLRAPPPLAAARSPRSAVIGLFGLMTRFEPSVLRASAMAALAATLAMPGQPDLAAARRRPGRHRRCVLVDPLLVRSVGFQLSVCAAVAIVVLAPRLAVGAPRSRRRSARPPGVTLAAQLGVAPVLLATFGPVPVASLPANLLCVPVAGLVMVWGLTGRPRRRRRRRRRRPRSCTCRRGSRSRGSSWSPSAPPARRSASSTSAHVVGAGRRAGGRWSLAGGRRRRSGGWAAARGRRRCSPRSWPPTRPRRCATSLAPGVVRWHGGGVDVVVLGGVGGRSSLGGAAGARGAAPRRRRHDRPARGGRPVGARRRSSTSCAAPTAIGATHGRPTDGAATVELGVARRCAIVAVPGRLVVDAVPRGP